MKCTYQKLMKDIDRGELSPVYFFYGPEELLKEEAVQSLIQRLVQQELRDFNLDILYGDETDWAQIIDRVMALPMMAERKVVMVRNVNQLTPSSRKRLLERLVTPFPHACLILTAPEVKSSEQFYKELEKVACHVNFRPLWENKIPEWVQHRARKHGKSMDPEAIRLLSDSIGNNLIALDNEIRKLAIYVGERPGISPQDVEAVVGQLRVHTVFEFCDAVGFRDLSKAMALLSRLLETEDIGVLLGNIRRRFSQLAKVRRMSRKGEPLDHVAFDLHISPIYVRKYIQQSANFDEDELENAFNQLYETELKLKTGCQKPKTAMTLLVYHLCRTTGADVDAQS